MADAASHEADAATDRLPRRRSGLAVAEFDDELVIFDPASHMIHHLVGISAVVFDACDGTTTRSQVAQEFNDVLNLDETRARRDIAAAELLLEGAALLEGTSVDVPSQEGPPCIGCGGESTGSERTRRRFVRRRVK